jgi:hypothetical protein
MRSSKPNCFAIAIGFCVFFIMIRVVGAYDVIPVQDGGELSGTISFKGAVPVLEPLKVNRNPDYCGNTVPDESLIINSENKGIQNVVVSFEEVPQGKKHDPTDISLNNAKCHFVPRTVAAMVGDSFQVKNSDPILHNTNLQFETWSILSVILEPNGKIIRKPVTENQGIIYGKCNVHRFMRTTILVFSHPYFAITDNNGQFKISDIPPGEYKVKIWHETLPMQEKIIKIEPRHETKVPLELSLKTESGPHFLSINQKKP